MSNPAVKKFVGSSLNKIAQDRAMDEMKRSGKALPCKVVSKVGSIVEVSFNVNSVYTIPNIRIPHAGPEWVRYPTQVGDLGFTIPADVQLGSVTGLGGGTPDMTTPGNLTALAFQPLAHTDWSPVDPNALDLNGPNGVVLRDRGNVCSLTLTPAGIVISVGGATYTFSATGLVSTVDIRAGTISLEHHTHSDPQGGSVSPPI